MNVTVETLAPCRRLVRVEVDAATVDATLNEITARFQRQARFPGFRPGKAPRDLVVRSYSKQIEDEAKRKLISESYRQALDEQKLRTVGTPDLEEIQYGRGQALLFAATVEIVPQFELPEYKGIPVKREIRTVTDEDIERAFAALRERQASYRNVDHPVQLGDFVVVGYSGTSDGKPLTEFAPTAQGITHQENFWIHVAQPDPFIPGFSEQLLGAKVGEHRTVTVEFPSDFVTSNLAGKKGVYEVDVKEIKEKLLPEVTDAFAKVYGAESLAKLRDGVRHDLQNELDYTQRRNLRNQLVRSLLERVQFDLPESIVLGETKSVVYDIVRENQQRGVSKEAIDQQKNEIYHAAAHSAKDRIKAGFILGEIAQKEGITVSQHEMAERIAALAAQNQVKPEKLVKQLQERKAIEEIRDQLLTSKVLDFLQLHARIEDAPAPAPSS